MLSYNVNAKYSTKDLKGYHNNMNVSLLDVFLGEKGPPVKIQMPNIFKDYHIVAKITSMGNVWPLSNALWMKFHNTYILS